MQAAPKNRWKLSDLRQLGSTLGGQDFNHTYIVLR